MKPSHYAAPRQLADCAFTPSADPIERPSADPFHEAGHRAVFWVSVAGIVVIAAILIAERFA